MTRLIPYILVFSTGVATALALVSCGGSSSDNLLPGGSASEIVANLDKVKKLNAEGDCTNAETAADQVRLQVTELPQSVDPKLRRALAEGAARLQSVTAGCVETTPETDFDTLTPSTEEAPTQSKQTTKETTRSSPTTTETQPTTTTTPTTTGTSTGPTTTTTPPPVTGGGSGGVGPGKPKPRKANPHQKKPKSNNGKSKRER